MTDLPPAGWYADPSDAAQQRYWDGAAWTEHVAPGPAPGASPYEVTSQQSDPSSSQTQGTTPYGPADGSASTQAPYSSPYATPSYAGQAGGHAPQPTSGAATASLVLGIASLVTCLGALLGIPAMILARKAKRQIAESGGQMDGQGMATAGFWTGLVATVLSVLAVVIVIIIVVAVGGTISQTVEDNCERVQRADGTTEVQCSPIPAPSPTPETLPG